LSVKVIRGNYVSGMENPGNGSRKTVRQTYSVEETARILGLSVKSTYAAIKRGEIPVVRIGGRIFVPKARLNALFSGKAAKIV
jgi:excisionase family DNA binding protein